MELQQRLNSHITLFLGIIGLLLLLLSSTPSMAQAYKRYQGSSTKNRKYNGGKRRNKVHKNIRNKKARRSKKRNNHTKQQRARSKAKGLKKVNRGGKRPNTVARKTKTSRRKSYFGKYPNSKNQFGTKLEAIIAVGGIADNHIDSTANLLVDNVSENNQYGIHFSGGILWHVSNNLGIQLTGGYTRMPNEGTYMELVGGGVKAKWNITSYNNKFSPFIIGGLNVDNWEYERKEFSEELQSETTPSSDEYVAVTVVKRDIVSYSSGQELLSGLKLGVGFDYKINQNIGAFAEIGYNYNQNFTKNNIFRKLSMIEIFIST